MWHLCGNPARLCACHARLRTDRVRQCADFALLRAYRAHLCAYRARQPADRADNQIDFARLSWASALCRLILLNQRSLPADDPTHPGYEFPRVYL